MVAIDEIKELVLREQFEITAHARERMSEREISTEDLIRLIINGEIIEDYPDDFPYPSALILGYIWDAPVHVVAAKGRYLVQRGLIRSMNTSALTISANGQNHSAI